MIVMSSFDVYLINNYMPFGGGGKRVFSFSHSIPSPRRAFTLLSSSSA